jgi:hypothetical protein
MDLHAETAQAAISQHNLNRCEMAALLMNLFKTPTVQIKIKRLDRMHYGNFSTVVRASAALIVFLDGETGQMEILPELSLISEFQVSADFAGYFANTAYTLIP